MSDLKDSGTRTGLIVITVLACLGLLACAVLIGASLIFTMPRLVAALATPTASLVPSTRTPVPSKTATPTRTIRPTRTSAPTATEPVLLEDSEYVGMWRYQDYWVWIKITPEGRVFQCRIATDRTVFSSEGILVEGDQILWEDIWEVDTITREGNSIFLDGLYGKFEYQSTNSEMEADCEAPF